MGGLINNDTAEEIAFSGGFGIVGFGSSRGHVVCVVGGSWLGVDLIGVTAGFISGLASSGVLTDEVFLIFLI